MIEPEFPGQSILWSFVAVGFYACSGRRGLVIFCLLLSFPASVMAVDGPWGKIPAIVIVAAEGDPRVQVAREAIDFWNQSLAELGTPFRLGPVVVTRANIPSGTMQRLRTLMLRRAEPRRFPESLWRLPGELIVVLSDDGFISFATRSSSNEKVVIGIRSDRFYPLTLPNVMRNVIAHELGHAIGLEHNSDPATLMCGRPASCRPAVFQSKEMKYFPLTDDEKTRLLEMYPATWTSQHSRLQEVGPS